MAQAIMPRSTFSASAKDDLDELDLKLVGALQVNPRADWGTLAKALGVTDTTVARHWDRLATDGIAWVTGIADVGAAFSGWVEIACQPALIQQVAATLVGDSHAVTVAYVTGQYDLLCVVITPNFDAFARYVTQRILQIPGVLATQSHPFASSYYREGSHWRLRTLEPGQQNALTPAGPSTDSERGVRIEVRPFGLALAEDGRITLRELADRLGVSVTTARARLKKLVDANKIKFRCEVARSFSPYPVTALYFARGRPERIEDLASHISGQEIRTCAIPVVGRANLVFSAWLQTARDVQRLQADLAVALPDLVVLDRLLVMQHCKLAGAVQDIEGRRIRVVPMDISQPVVIPEQPDQPGETEPPPDKDIDRVDRGTR